MLNKAQMAELDRIAGAAPDGKLRPGDVERAAREPDSPIHNKFEWDDGKAGRLYRLDQARAVIEVYVEMMPGVGEVRGYVSLADDRTRGGGYTRTSDALEDEVTRTLLVQQLRDDVRQVMRRYNYLRPLAPSIFDRLESVVSPQAPDVQTQEHAATS